VTRDKTPIARSSCRVSPPASRGESERRQQTDRRTGTRAGYICYNGLYKRMGGSRRTTANKDCSSPRRRLQSHAKLYVCDEELLQKSEVQGRLFPDRVYVGADMGCGASRSGPAHLRSAGPAVAPPTVEGNRPAMHRRRSSHVSPEIEPCDGKRAQDGKGTYSGIQQLPTVGNIPAHRIGTYSSHGLKPGHNGEPFAKINQDRGLITYPFDDDPRMALLVVLDGHGSNGEQVSEFVMWKLQEQLLAEPTKLRDENLVSAHFTKAFEETDRLLAESSVSAKVSGTTCVACLVVGQTLWVANTGDSRAVMATSSPDGKLSITPLSYDQKPDDPQEVCATDAQRSSLAHPCRAARHTARRAARAELAALRRASACVRGLLPTRVLLVASAALRRRASAAMAVA
jgi:hypothetical protein